jgi:hypothetical protein
MDTLDYVLEMDELWLEATRYCYRLGEFPAS